VAASVELVFDPTGPVLGIDPGLSRCGYGAVRGRGADGRAVAYGVIRTAPSDPLPDRLCALEAELAALVAELRPAAVAVERVLFQANVRTAMAVGQASGLALLVAARAGIPVAQYSPNEVKLAVAGYGGADKIQVQTMVMRLLGLAEVPSPPDAADALALALCHGWGAGVQRAAATADGGTSGTGFERAVAAALAREGAS
jgi:crossover junction endodeoxyribonuclease RuvC